MSYPEFFEITKIDAARRQLRTAIELWFADGDPISIHTLAAAAYQIIHDLNRRNKGPDLLLDSKYIKDEKRREFVSLVKSTSNFMKHADRGKMGMAKSIEFSSDSNVGLITFFFGACGAGGLLSILRSISSARFNASARGTESASSRCLVFSVCMAGV